MLFDYFETSSQNPSNVIFRHIDEMFGGSVLQIWSDLEGASSTSSSSGMRSTGLLVLEARTDGRRTTGGRTDGRTASEARTR
jgi:hypothetical protein